jgi:hypothetical protein
MSDEGSGTRFLLEQNLELREQRRALTEEIVRLREALEQIAKGDVAQSSFKGYLDEAYQAIAKDALEGK